MTAIKSSIYDGLTDVQRVTVAIEAIGRGDQIEAVRLLEPVLSNLNRRAEQEKERKAPCDPETIRDEDALRIYLEICQKGRKL